MLTHVQLNQMLYALLRMTCQETQLWKGFVGAGIGGVEGSGFTCKLVFGCFKSYVDLG